jgi:subtilisin family serine protease
LQNTAALQPLLLKYQLTVADQFGSRPVYRLMTIGGADPTATIAALSLEPTVLSAEPNYIHGNPEASKNGAWAIGEPSAYQAQWAPAAMHLSDAQLLSQGAGVTVAVLDTGVDATHPALVGHLVPGFDFVDFDNDPSEVGDHVNNVAFGHGTHVAGLVALVAPQAKIMPIRVLDVNGQGNAWVLAQAVLYAIDPDHNPATNDGATIINLSLATPNKTKLMDLIAAIASCEPPDPVAGADPPPDLSDPAYDVDRERCEKQGGTVIIAAAGNDASNSIKEFPAAEHAYGLLSVGATSSTGNLATFSNFGPWVSVAAPGDGITSTVPGGGFGVWSGTSMAAPLTTGVAALLRSMSPSMSADDIVRRITRSSGNVCGNSQITAVDANAALSDSPFARSCQ